MILKGSQRANGADLAIHLMNAFDNERVEVAEVYGTVAGDLMGAFAEMEVVASATRAKNYLYSLSINPSAPLTRDQYYDCIRAIEHRLGLSGQPRAVVFHVKGDKNGVPREHCHVVWSKIDAGSMRAIHMAYDHAKLCDLSCELARKYGLDLPPGLRDWEENNRRQKDKLEPTLAEKAQQDATGITSYQRRAEITAAYEQSDSAAAFVSALEQRGYVLARGDRRGFVVVDEFGNPHSLSRYVQGHTAKDIRSRLALAAEELPSVDEAREIARQRKQAREELSAEALAKADKERERDRADALRTHMEQARLKKQEERRIKLRIKEQQLLTRQQGEKLALQAAQLSESRGLLFRLRSAVADLIRNTPGLRSVLGPIERLTQLDPKDRHTSQREALARRHGRERLEIARLKRSLALVESREKAGLERKLRRQLRALIALERKVRQDFDEAARDRAANWPAEAGEGDLQVSFNDAAEFVQGSPDGGGDDDDGRQPSWKHRAEKRRRGLKPRRGKGLGHRRR